MRTSRAIGVQGRFLGSAVTDASNRRFAAADPLVEALDGATFPSLVLARNTSRSSVGPAR